MQGKGENISMRRFLLFLLFIPFMEAGAADIFSSPLPVGERESVEAIFESISSHNLVKCNFSQNKLIKRLNRTLTSTGRMLFDSEKGIAWIVEKPFPTTTVLTENAMIQRGSGGQERILSAEGNESFHRFSQTVQSLFLGRLDVITEEYEIFFREMQGNSWHIGLVPQDSTLKQIVSAFELKGSGFIESFIIHEAGGDNITYYFSDQEFPTLLSPEESRVFP
jgi:DNA-binding ferritin-like protein (Dps family)